VRRSAALRRAVVAGLTAALVRATAGLSTASRAAAAALDDAVRVLARVLGVLVRVRRVLAELGEVRTTRQ
jgi:hypothetical protein